MNWDLARVVHKKTSKLTIAASCVVLASLAALVVVLVRHPLGEISFIQKSYIQELQDLPLGPVRFSGTVTYIDPERKQFWMQDGTGAIHLHIDPVTQGIQVGQELIVTARKASPYNPIVGAMSIELADAKVTLSRRRHPLPPALPVALNAVPEREKNGMRVIFSGIVHHANPIDGGHTGIFIGQGGREMWIIAPPSLQDVDALVDSKVEVTGVSETKYRTDGGMQEGRVLVAAPEDIRVVEKAPATVPIQSIRELSRSTTTNKGHLVRLRGKIEARLGPASWLLSDPWGAIACYFDSSPNLALGAVVEVNGFPVADGVRTDLNHCNVDSSSANLGTRVAGGNSIGNPIRTVAEVRKLTPEQASEALPVEITGVVTFVDNDWHQLFLQDASGGIYLKYSGAAFSILQGEKLKVRGITGAGDYAPVIVAPTFTRLGNSPLPKPLPVTQEDAFSGILDSQFVTINGTIHPVKPGQNPKHMGAELFTPLGQVHLQIGPAFASDDVLRTLVDAKVRVNGVCSTIFNSRRQLVGIQLSVSKPENLQVLSAGVSDPFTKAAIAINRLLQYSPDRNFEHRIKVQGVVTMPGPGFFYMQDQTGGLEVQSDDREIRPGDHVEAVGYTTAGGGYSPVLTDAMVRVTGHQQSAEAEKVTAIEAAKGTYDSHLVTIEGRLLNVVNSVDHKTLLMQSGAQTFNAQLYISDSSVALPLLEPGSVLRLTGISSVQVDRKFAYLLVGQDSPGFRLIIRSAQDVVVLSHASWWNARHTSVVLAGLSILALVGLLMQLVMSRRMREQEVALEAANEKARCIRELILATKEVTASPDFSARVSPRGDPDLAELGAEFNKMLSELELRDRLKAEAEKKLQHQALTDELTGLPNRRLLSDRLAQNFARAEREKRLLGLLYLDLDGFKLVNDSLGHGIGDVLLSQVAERLQSRIRKSDTLARLGGDEFAIVLSGLNTKEEAEKVASILLDVISQKFDIEGHEIRISASVGISLYPENGKDAAELLQQADSAMYAAKRSGKNRMLCFTSEMGLVVRERVTLENELRGALDRGEIHVHYQPEFEVAGNRLVRFEALARWTHPTLGEIPPSKFVPIAEESGLIVPLGAFILERACLDAVQWQMNPEHPIQVAVNVSSVEFMQDGFVTRVAEMLQRTGLSPNLLQLELTETVMLHGTQRATEAMKRLRSLGVGLAIDDFGTGYSCFGYLPQLPFNALKIDRSFVKDLESRPEMKALIQSLIALAHNLSMQVIVEGIETHRQLTAIEGFGGNQVQGFLLGRPTSDPLSVIKAALSEAAETGYGKGLTKAAGTS